MKRRLIKKVERMMLVDKVCELQRGIDEYDRFLGDLMLMLITKNPEHKALASDLARNHDYANEIWGRVVNLIKENAELREKGRVGDKADSEHPAGRSH